MMEKGFCVWFTGLSAAGKTTLSRLLEGALLERGLMVEVLDGEDVRNNLSKDLGFSREDRETHLRRIAFVTKLLIRNGIVVLVAAIIPYQGIREEVRAEIGDFVEVYLNTPLEVCIKRDPKGLYQKAQSGEIKNFTGIDDPFEPAERAEIVLRTGEESPEESLARILLTLEMLKLIPPMPQPGYSEEEAEVIKQRLTDLGYI